MPFLAALLSDDFAPIVCDPCCFPLFSHASNTTVLLAKVCSPCNFPLFSHWRHKLEHISFVCNPCYFRLLSYTVACEVLMKNVCNPCYFRLFSHYWNILNEIEDVCNPCNFPLFSHRLLKNALLTGINANQRGVFCSKDFVFWGMRAGFCVIWPALPCEE